MNRGYWFEHSFLNIIFVMTANVMMLNLTHEWRWSARLLGEDAAVAIVDQLLELGMLTLFQWSGNPGV